MTPKPKIKPTLTTADKAIELLGWLTLIAVWGLAIFYFPNLPETIPSHYNGAGVVDGYGEKENIFISPAIATLLFIGMTVLNKYPHIFNYPTIITIENAQRQYSNANRMIRVLKLSIVVLFGHLTLSTIQNAKGDSDGLGSWFLPLEIGVIITPVIYFLVKSFKAK